LIVVANFYEMVPAVKHAVFETPGDHADEMETSLLLHLCPELVELDQAGKGERVPFAIKSLSQPGVWTPRPWSKSHPDTGSGDPSRASAEKGKKYFEAVAAAVADLVFDLAMAQKGQLP
jgi:creatinine amidohydrolase